MASVLRIGSVQVPPRTSRRRRLEPALRLRVRLHRASLDRQIAAGAEPAWTPELALRARQLVSPRSRRSLAKALESLVASAESRRVTISAAVPVRRRATRDARDDLLGLAGRLRGAQPVDPGGVALALALIVDPASPVYAGGDLSAAATTVAEALDGRLR